MDLHHIACELACVEPKIRPAGAGWSTWAKWEAWFARQRPLIGLIEAPACTVAVALPSPESERLRVRAARGLLMVEGLVIGVPGGVALAASMGYARFGADGMPMLGLKVTPPHAVLLLVVGSVALLACLGRRTALVFSAFTAFGWAALTIVCALKASHHAPGVLGFDPGDSVFYGALSAYNLVTSLLLAAPLLRHHVGPSSPR